MLKQIDTRTAQATVFVLSAAVMLALMLGMATTAFGATGGDPEVRAQALPTKDSVPTKGLMAPLPAEDGKIKVEESSVQGASETGTAATQAKWLSGTSSNTHYWNPIHSQVQLLTTESVSYWGTEDGSYPKVGELYWGKVTIGNINPTMSTPVMPEVELPRSTRFALVANDPNMKIRCVLDNFLTGASRELTGDLCPQAPRQPGTFEPYQLAPKAGFWTIRPGEAISVIFPIYSTDELKGWAATPADCLSSSIWAAASIEVWDAPEVTDSCPVSHAQADGVDQGVWVAPNPPTIQYPSPSATKITSTGATTTGHLFYHFQAGTAFLDLGTTTSYGRTESLAIRDTHDVLAISNDWTGLKANTTYHWRLRFVDSKGRTFTGADQTFKTAAIPDTTKPKVNRVIPAENATGIAPGSNISAYFSEAMQGGTINANTVKIFKNGTTTALPAAVSYDAVAKRAVLNPNANLQRGTTYRVVVTTGAKDLAGNLLDQNPTLSGNQPKTWVFTVVK
jgi:Bacterial Ig-like domain